LQDIQELQRANARLQLAKEQSAWDAAMYKAKFDRALGEVEALVEQGAAVKSTLDKVCL